MIWQFPDTLPEVAVSSTGRSAAETADKKAPGIKWLFRKDRAARTEAPVTPWTGSCPAFHDLPTPGKSLMWCQWPEAYRNKLAAYFDFYWDWMEDSWPLYRQYKESGFKQKPSGFEERFGSTLDPETGSEPGTLPFASVLVTKTSNEKDYHYVLFDPAATFDLYLKITAFQLVLDRGSFLNWKLDDYDPADLSVLLDGRRLFQYVPAGTRSFGPSDPPWEKEGYWASFQVPASPLVLMKFLLRKALLRESRFETVSELFEWERRHLIHGSSDTYERVGGCDDDPNEIRWGFKGQPPVTSILHGRPLTCTDPPMGYDGVLSPHEIHPDHNIQGCITSGPLREKVLRQLNVAAENFCFEGGHCSTRFVVERVPLERMLARVEASLPFEPDIDQKPTLSGWKESLFPEADLSLSTGGSGLRLEPTGKITETKLQLSFPEGRRKGDSLANAYLDHNDNPYSLWGEWEIPVQEVLFSETTFRRWFPEIPEGLTQEQEQPLIDAQQKRIGLRFNQLIIDRLPLSLFQMYCYSKDYEKPRDQMSSIEYKYYSPEELEKMGFWTRFYQKYEELGGCETIPPREFRGFPSD